MYNTSARDSFFAVWYSGKLEYVWQYRDDEQSHTGPGQGVELVARAFGICVSIQML